ncbi:MAG TPA: GAF domain-containing protein [Anaerolineae bacterium]|nr:GAF domain-containing protein [Anaerolineae bacterium]
MTSGPPPNFRDMLASLQQLSEADEKRRAMLERLVEASREILSSVAEGHPRRVLQVTVEQACRLAEADCAVLYPYDPDREDFFDNRFVVGHGLRTLLDPSVKARKEGGMAAFVKREGMVVRNDIDREDPDMLKSDFIQREGIAAFVGLLLVTGQRPAGVLYINYREPHVFEEQESEILRLFANQTTISLNLSHLLEEYHQRTTELSALNAIGQKLTSSAELTKDEIVGLIHSQVSQLMDADNFYLALYDQVTDEVSFVLVMEDGKPAKVGEPPYVPRRGGKGLTELIIQKRQPMLARHGIEEIYEREGRRDYVGKLAKSWIGAPMLYSNDVLGVMATYNWLEENVYDEEALQVLQTIASQGAVALHISESLQSQIHNLKTVREINRAIVNELDPQRCMNRILEEVMKHFGCDFAIIQLVDAAKNELVIHRQKGTEGRELADYRRIRLGEGVTGRAAVEKRTLRIGDVRSFEGYLDYIEGTRSEMATPLHESGQVIGVLSVESTGMNAFDQDDEALFEMVAEEVVIALRNARYVEQLRRHEEQQRFEYLGLLAGGVAHRVGSRGGLIGLHVNKLRKIIDPSQVEATALLDQIEEERQYLVHLSEALFIPAQASESRVEAVDVNQLLNDACAKAHNILKEIDFSIEVADNLPAVRGNKWLVEAFVELMTNAVEAMKESAERKIRVNTRFVTDQVEVLFIDTGHGFSSEEEIRKAFQLFYTGSQGKAVGGYGLWWLKTILTGIGGDIDIKSEAGSGTTCRVKLPLASP